MSQNYDPNQQPPAGGYPSSQPPYQSPYNPNPENNYASGGGSNYGFDTTAHDAPPPPPPTYASNPAYPAQPNTYDGGQQPNSGYVPNQGMPNYVPPQVPQKKRGITWIVVSIISVVLLVIIALCGVLSFSIVQLANNGKPTPTVIQSTATATEQKTPTPDNQPTPTPDSTNSNPNLLSVGQTHTSQDVSVTLVSAKIIEGDSYSSPKAGKVFVLVDVKIVNNNSEKKYYNPFDYKVITGEDIKSKETFAPNSVDDSKRLGYGDLQPGKTTEGQMVFSVVKGDAKAKIRWEPVWHFDDDVRYEWKLGLY